MDAFDYVILGGGVAGLCAAKRLLEIGIQPLVIEAGTYPSHKVCGEFISPSSLAVLRNWGLEPIPIHEVELHTPSRNLKFSLSQPAGSLSHLTLDTQLALQIQQQGACLLTETKVTNLLPASSSMKSHLLELSSGGRINAKNLIIAAGRLPALSTKKFNPKYVGFKAHFRGINLQAKLCMFSFPGAYLGIVPVENGNSNIACLAKIDKVQQFSSPKEFIQNLVTSHSLLNQLISSGLPLFDQWMEVCVPKFGLKDTPNWPKTYWIGDAASTIPPASGNGLSLAIASGYLAAEHAARDCPEDFKCLWRKKCAGQIRLAKCLHQFFLNPTLGSVFLKLSDWLPIKPQKIFEMTRESII